MPRNLHKKRPTRWGIYYGLCLQLLRKQYGERCAYCDRRMSCGPQKTNAHWDNRASIEHRVALSHGGQNSPGNVILVCRRCNDYVGDAEGSEKKRLIRCLKNRTTLWDTARKCAPGFKNHQWKRGRQFRSLQFPSKGPFWLARGSVVRCTHCLMRKCQIEWYSR